MHNTIPWTPSPDSFDELWDNSQRRKYHDVTADTVPDMLETMYAKQLQHLNAYQNINPEMYLPGELWGKLDNPRTQAALRENAGYVVEELMEAISGHLKNKPWKQSPRPVSEHQFREELADVWHFFIQLHIIAGLSPIDIFQDYFRKALINNERQKNGY